MTQRSSTRPAKKPTKKVAKAKAGAKAKAKVTTAKKAIKAKPTKSAAGNGSSEPQIVEARPPAELPIPVSTFFF